MPKTQILITDIPTAYFKEKWPDQLEKELFVKLFPQFSSNLLYYSPLAFLNRIVIIMDNEETTIQMYNSLKNLLASQKRTAKLYLTESLLTKPKSRSSDDLTLMSKRSPERQNTNTTTDTHLEQPESQRLQTPSQQLSQASKPILSIDTDPSSTGISTYSLSIGSPSLSPDRTSLESPTMLKFDSQSKLHYYKEPLPKLNKRVSQSTFDSSPADTTTYLFKPRNTGDLASASSTDMVSSSSSRIDIPPPSPSITLNEFHL
ncbi:hypothetical protein HG535_0F05300 [Zygotorulaspora mrakii]|uniref:Uncharacterized protein n=1 Tax=Zygotorulaspora mrakii TaxID=42260 RepID=A0A7H9B5N5_ZYGMR|nr:uncharacterized protein HG535_0F05300 [Zygotorulaspora mrakii]QLG74018.1 hypothetical protein HG535_0F05300 [Zygotorulaspora mrakii]